MESMSIFYNTDTIPGNMSVLTDLLSVQVRRPHWIITLHKSLSESSCKPGGGGLFNNINRTYHTPESEHRPT